MEFIKKKTVSVGMQAQFLGNINIQLKIPFDDEIYFMEMGVTYEAYLSENTEVIILIYE